MTSSTRNILVGLGLGVLVGVFLGEHAALLQFAADAYLRLLQMTVLPYVIVSLVTGIGSLDPKRARDLFVRVGALTLVLWGLALAVVFLMPLTFPAIQNAFFFSTTLVEERAPLDFVALYIPSNPFQSLANSIVPAVVLFSAFLGVALMGIEKKEPLLGSLQVLERMLGQANRFSVRLTPFGLFAIAAVTVGTADTEQMGRLRVFLIGYAAMSLLMALWILPGLVACVTPIPVRRILRTTRDALITAFITGDLFIVLPALIDRSKELLVEHGFPETKEGAPADVIVPAFYSFPHVAKLLSLSFVLFAAWYSDTEVALLARAQLALAGIVSLFGSMNAAIPFLLDLVRVPSATFQLFLATGVLNSRFGTLAAAMHMVVLALAGTYALTGQLRFSFARILRYLLVTAGATAVTLAAVVLLLRATGMGRYDKDEVARNMQLLRPPSQKAVVLRELPTDRPASREGASVLQAVQERGLLRVGYFEGAMPYTFVNGRGELVGLDVEMANTLAAELGVALEFAPVPRDRLTEVLDAGLCDVVMGGVILTTRRGANDRLLLELHRRDPGLRRPRLSPRRLLQCRVDPPHAGSQGGGSRPALPPGPRASGVPGSDHGSDPLQAREHHGFLRGPGPLRGCARLYRRAGLLPYPAVSRLLGGRPAPGRAQAAARLPGGQARHRSRALSLELDRPQAEGRDHSGSVRPLDPRARRAAQGATLVGPAQRPALGELMKMSRRGRCLWPEVG